MLTVAIISLQPLFLFVIGKFRWKRALLSLQRGYVNCGYNKFATIIFVCDRRA